MEKKTFFVIWNEFEFNYNHMQYLYSLRWLLVLCSLQLKWEIDWNHIARINWHIGHNFNNNGNFSFQFWIFDALISADEKRRIGKRGTESAGFGEAAREGKKLFKFSGEFFAHIQLLITQITATTKGISAEMAAFFVEFPCECRS